MFHYQTSEDLLWVAVTDCKPLWLYIKYRIQELHVFVSHAILPFATTIGVRSGIGNYWILLSYYIEQPSPQWFNAKQWPHRTLLLYMTSSQTHWLFLITHFLKAHLITVSLFSGLPISRFCNYWVHSKVPAQMTITPLMTLLLTKQVGCVHTISTGLILGYTIIRECIQYHQRIQ
jgi:hypothetical protein